MNKKRFSSMSNLDVVRSYLDGKRPYLTISTHVSEKEKFRKDGERWTDTNGIKWKKKGGKTIRLTKTQGDIIREAIGNEMDCKKCNLKYKWGTKHDTKFLRRMGLCSDCLIEYDTKLRILGIYGHYEDYHMASHELGFLKEAREKIKETIEYFNRSGGDITKLAETEYDEHIVWKNTNKDKILEDATSDLTKIESLIITGSVVTEGLKKQYYDDVDKYNLKSYVR